MSPRMSSAEYALWELKRQPKQAKLIPTTDDLESELHDLIIGWCRRQDPQVPYGHARMDKKSTYTNGYPDFALLLPAGRLVLIECKTGKNDLDEDQQAFKFAASKVGHEVHVC